MENRSRSTIPEIQQPSFEGLDSDIIATCLFDYFINKVKLIKDEIRTGINSSTTLLPAILSPVTTKKLVKCQPTTPTEVERLISTAPSDTSPPDAIPKPILKLFKTKIAQTMSHIASQSFESSRFPASMKIGSVTPLLKKPGLDMADFKNFRPITSLSTVSKLLERHVLQRLRLQLESSLNYCELQSAYRSGRYNETAVVKVVDDILGHVETVRWSHALVSTSRRHLLQ